MKLKIVIAMLLMFVSTAALFAQSKKRSATRFTSVYTNLGSGCKTLKGSGGTDDASLCNGPGGYRVRVYGSAAALNIVAEIRGRDDVFPLATLSIGFDESKTRLEWRLANGKPFAVIMRVPAYGDPTIDDPYFGKVIGQELIVKGLKNFDHIEYAVDAITPAANAKAREFADTGYKAATN